LGDVERAVTYFEQALRLSQEIGAKHEKGEVFSYLGRAYASQSDMTRANSAFTQALTISPRGRSHTGASDGVQQRA
jgi:G-protein signaling modulator 2